MPESFGTQQLRHQQLNYSFHRGAEEESVREAATIWRLCWAQNGENVQHWDRWNQNGLIHPNILY